MADDKCAAGQPQMVINMEGQQLTGCAGLLVLTTKVDQISEDTREIRKTLKNFEVAPNGARIKTAATAGGGVTAVIGAAALGVWHWFKSKYGGQ